MYLHLFWLPVYLHLFLSSYFVPSFCLVSSVNFIFPLGLNLYSLYFSLNENFFFALSFLFCLCLFLYLFLIVFQCKKILLDLFSFAHCKYHSTVFLPFILLLSTTCSFIFVLSFLSRCFMTLFMSLLVLASL